MIFKALDPDMPEDEVEQIISEVDEDGSGTVDYEGLYSIFFSNVIHLQLSIFLFIEFYKLMTG
jgi:Ca2+-binding EF-hand superfamily protein